MIYTRIMVNRILDYIDAQLKSHKSYTKIAKQIGLPLSSLWRIAHREREGDLTTWTKLSEWYQSETGLCPYCGKRHRG